MIVGAHIFVCMWVLVHHNCPDIDAGDVTPENIENACGDVQISATYTEALFYILCLMLGVSSPPLLKGSGIFEEDGNIERASVTTFLLGACVVLVGFSLFAILLAHVQVVISGWNQVEAKFRTKMDQIKHEMDYFSIPGDIQYRIRRHFDYLWINQRAFGEIMLLRDNGMSEVLRMEIAAHLYKDVLTSVPYFQNSSRLLLGKIALAIKTQVYLPDDVVLHKGDFGHEMYVIRKGNVKICLYTKGGHDVVLSEGAFFGEMALVMHLRRNASVKAITMCDLCVLHKDYFDHIVVEYPQFATKVKDMVVARQVEQLNVTDMKRRETLSKDLHQMIDEQISLKQKVSVQELSKFHDSNVPHSASLASPSDHERRSAPGPQSMRAPATHGSIGQGGGGMRKKSSFVIKRGRVELNPDAENENNSSPKVAKPETNFPRETTHHLTTTIENDTNENGVKLDSFNDLGSPVTSQRLRRELGPREKKKSFVIKGGRVELSEDLMNLDSEKDEEATDGNLSDDEVIDEHDLQNLDGSHEIASKGKSRTSFSHILPDSLSILSKPRSSFKGPPIAGRSQTTGEIMTMKGDIATIMGALQKMDQRLSSMIPPS